MSIGIRFAGADDAAFVAGLWLENWRSTYRGLLSDGFLDSLSFAGALAEWRAYLENPANRIIICAGDDGAALGFAAVEPDGARPNCLYLHSLHVKAAARGRGVGTRLICAAWDWAAENGCTEMSINVVCGNENAKRLYMGLGARHLKYFKDNFNGEISNSETLLWTCRPGR